MKNITELRLYRTDKDIPGLGERWAFTDQRNVIVAPVHYPKEDLILLESSIRNMEGIEGFEGDRYLLYSNQVPSPADVLHLGCRVYTVSSVESGDVCNNMRFLSLDQIVKETAGVVRTETVQPNDQRFQEYLKAKAAYDASWTQLVPERSRALQQAEAAYEQQQKNILDAFKKKMKPAKKEFDAFLGKFRKEVLK